MNVNGDSMGVVEYAYLAEEHDEHCAPIFSSEILALFILCAINKRRPRTDSGFLCHTTKTIHLLRLKSHVLSSIVFLKGLGIRL